MTRTGKPRRGLIRQVMMTLAALAVVVKALIPAGYMVAAPTNERPFPIILCTIDGMVEVKPGDIIPGHDPAAEETDAAKASSPCAFAGFGIAGPAPGEVALLPSQVAVYAPHLAPADEQATHPADVHGPPLPARGPPVLTI